MSNKISNQNIAGLQDEMLRNISSIKQKISEWLERPQVGGVESLCDTVAEVRDVLSLLGKNEAAELSNEIISVIIALQKTVDEAGEQTPEHFDNAGAEIASAILILDDYIDHLNDKRDIREHLIEMLRVMRSLKDNSASSESYSAQPRISKDTLQALANKVSEIIESSRNQIEQHRRNPANPLNTGALISHNEDLINLFAILNLDGPQLLLHRINQIFAAKPTEAQWVDIAEAMILVEETLQKVHNKHAATDVADFSEARLQQARHSRALEVSHLLKDTGLVASQFFESLRKKVVHDESVHSGQDWRNAAIRLAHYSAIAEMVGLSSLADALRGMGKISTAISLNSNIPAAAYEPVIGSLVGAEYIFSDLAQDNYPSEQDIIFLKDAVMHIAGLVPVNAEAENLFASLIDADEDDNTTEREDLSDAFGEILSADLAKLDRFGAPIDIQEALSEQEGMDASQLNPSIVHVASIHDIKPGTPITTLENVTIQGAVRQALPQEHAIPVVNTPATQPAIPFSGDATPSGILTAELSHNADTFPTPKAQQEFSLPSIESSAATEQNRPFVPYFHGKALADLDNLKVPVNKQEFINAHADAVMDDEIREFFGEEFAEILSLLNETYPKWAKDASSQVLTTDIRRAFHTLKGSGRTVGYESLGEFAWQHEQLLNRVLDNHYRANSLVQSTVGDAIDLLNILNQQHEFAEHQGALLRQATAAEFVREALMQDSQLGESAQSFASASLQWRLHDGNLDQANQITDSLPLQTPSAVQTEIQTESSVTLSAEREETETPMTADFAISDASPNDGQDFDDRLQTPQDEMPETATSASTLENLDTWVPPFDLLSQDAVSDTVSEPSTHVTQDQTSNDGQDFDDWLQAPQGEIPETATSASTLENLDTWVPPFDLLSQDTVADEASTHATQDQNSDDLPLEVDFSWDVPSDTSLPVESETFETLQSSEVQFDLMSDEQWHQAMAVESQNDDIPSDYPLLSDGDLSAQTTHSDDAHPAVTRIPDSMTASDIFIGDSLQIDSIHVDALAERDARVVSKVVRTLEKGLEDNGGNEAIEKALQATLQRQLQDDYLSNPARLAALAKAVQDEMAHNDAVMLGQVQNIFSQIQAQATPAQQSPPPAEIAPIDPRAEQIIRMLEKGLANSADNPALTQALEATLQHRLSNEVLGDSDKLDALMEEISATLAAFPTIDETTAEADDFMASVEQIAQSIELGLSLGELSPNDKDALAAAIKQELLFPPASEQDSEQLKEAVEIRLQEKQLLPAGDIRDVVNNAFSNQPLPTDIPFTPEISSKEAPTATSVDHDSALTADFSWSDDSNSNNVDASAPEWDKNALSTLQKTLDKAFDGGNISDSVAAGIGMALAHQWQQKDLPVDESAFADIAEQLRNNNPHHASAEMDNILQALAKRLGIADASTKQISMAADSTESQWLENAFAPPANTDFPSITTLQKTLDKALHEGEVDEMAAAGISMALAHQWQQHQLPRDEESFALIAGQLRNNSSQYDAQDIDNILQALASRLGIQSAPITSYDHLDQWFDDGAQTNLSPVPDKTADSSFKILQKTLDKALQSGNVDDSAAAGIGMTLARQWQQAKLPVNDDIFAQVAAVLRENHSHTEGSVEAILHNLADRLGIAASPSSRAPSSSAFSLTDYFAEDFPAATTAATAQNSTSADYFADIPSAQPDDEKQETSALADFFINEPSVHEAESPAENIFEDAFATKTVVADESGDTWQNNSRDFLSNNPQTANAVSNSGEESIALSQFDIKNQLDKNDHDSAWDIEERTPVPDAQANLRQDNIRLSFDLHPSAQRPGASEDETWSSSVEYVRPSISMKSSAASQRLSQELEQLAQHPMLDDALVRHPAGTLEDKSADAAAFLHAVDKFENLSQHIEDTNNPETINELIESVYDIEDSIESENAPDWLWRMLDSVEQLLLMYKYQGANVSSNAASILRQSANLIEHHRDQDNEEEALEAINSLIAARQERSKMGTGQPDNIARPYPPPLETGYGDELLHDPNADTMLADTFLDEAMTLFGRSQLDAERWDEDLSRVGILDRIRRDMHTLKGSARMAGYMAIGDLTHAVENLIDSILNGYSESSSRAAAILSGAMWQGMLMLDNIRDGYLPQTDPYILNNISEYLNQPLPYPEVAEREKLAKEQQRLEAEEAQFRPVETSAPVPVAEETPAQAPPQEGLGEGFDSDIDPLLVDVFTDEAEELLANTEHHLEDITNSGVAEEFKRTMHTLKGSARLVGLSAMGDTAHLMESVMEKVPELNDEQIGQAKILLQGGYDSLRNMLDAVLRQDMPKSADGVNRCLELFVREGIFEWPPAQAEGSDETPAAQSHDTPRTQEQDAVTPREVAAAPSQTAAATSPAAPALDDTAVRTNTAAAEPPVTPLPQVDTAAAASASPESSATESAATPAQEPAEQETRPETPAKDDIADKAPDVSRFVRVDAQLLDEIIAMVGEASIMRSRMENISGGVEFSLGELTRISTRIAEQMRRLDNETEAQMLFRREQRGSDDEHFDPLEMDRFTEIQQLSRQLSEAIDDLKNVRDTLANDNAVLRDLASQQGIIQRSLQDRLLTTQLMRFDVNEPRLKRLVRQTARAVGKDVQFILEGGQVELERRLLEDVLPALEHMIRNSIAHGIELPAQRRAAGKPEIGTIKLVVAVQTSEVIIRLIDDGQGFDYERIRSKAREKGFLDESLADDKQYLNSLILRSGFSTAQSLTQLSGRGVGMDVVNEMIKQRRGRLGADSLPGKGTEFTIVMPFSMSISEVLLVDIGGRTYAAPMSSITAVSQVSSENLAKSAAGEAVYHHYDERDYRLYVLGGYFEPGKYEFTPESAQLPALFVDTGDEAAAFHVDRILNRLEIIVKNVNRQVLNIPGISGATILGDASVVPVLELMDLARRIGAIVPQQEAEAVPESTEKRILVVDDSVTMRKVSTRLLERNHFIVKAAKDGLDAIEVLEHFKPDLIMLDIEMPRMDGFEFAAHVRQNSDIPNVPIVMVTSRTGDKHRERAGQIGVQGYLGKPYREDILMETLNSLLGNGELS